MFFLSLSLYLSVRRSVGPVSNEIHVFQFSLSNLLFDLDVGNGELINAYGWKDKSPKISFGFFFVAASDGLNVMQQHRSPIFGVAPIAKHLSVCHKIRF